MTQRRQVSRLAMGIATLTLPCIPPMVRTKKTLPSHLCQRSSKQEHKRSEVMNPYHRQQCETASMFPSKILITACQLSKALVLYYGGGGADNIKNIYAALRKIIVLP